MKTIFHAYRFDIAKASEKTAYAALCERLKDGPHKMESFTELGASYYKPVLDGREIELETKHLFDNQWNTAPLEGISDKGLRVFDWAEDVIFQARNIKQGHWLEQTADMREIRRNTHKCGYCGAQEPAAKGYVFCPHCIDSKYLKESDLHITRMRPIECSGPGAEFKPLSEAERAHLLPLYRDAQLHGATERGRARIAKARRDVEEKHRKVIYAANTERDGFVWLMDRGIRTDNVIYYSHADRFCFGWRVACDAEFTSNILDVISEFPFRYEIKCADGRKLENA